MDSQESNMILLKTILGELPMQISFIGLSASKTSDLGTKLTVTTTSPSNVLYKAVNKQSIFEFDALNYIAYRLEDIFKESARVRIFIMKNDDGRLAAWASAYINHEQYLVVYVS